MQKLYILLVALALCWPAFASQAVNINTAPASAIADNLKGIGPAKAQAIVEYRLVHGDFKYVDELVNVKGISIKTVDKNRDLIIVAKAKPKT